VFVASLKYWGGHDNNNQTGPNVVLPNPTVTCPLDHNPFTPEMEEIVPYHIFGGGSLENHILEF